MLFAAIHLADDLDGLTRLVVEREEEYRRVHDAGSLLVEGAEELREIVSVGAQRSEATRGLEPRAELLVRGQRAQHVPHRRRCGACRWAKNIGGAGHADSDFLIRPGAGSADVRHDHRTLLS